MKEIENICNKTTTAMVDYNSQINDDGLCDTNLIEKSNSSIFDIITEMKLFGA